MAILTDVGRNLEAMSEPVAPWERSSDESSKAFGAFCCYRDLPPGERSAARVASEYGRHVRLIERWRALHRWVERAAAFDAECDRRRRASMLDEYSEMGRRQAADASAAQAALMIPVRELLRRLDEPAAHAEIFDLPLVELVALVARVAPGLATAARVEREARGLSAADPSPVNGTEPIDPIYRRPTRERSLELARMTLELEPGLVESVLAEKGLIVVPAGPVDDRL